MNKSHDNQLDPLLQDWAQSHAVGTDDLASLERRIKDRMLTEHLLTPAPQVQSSGAPHERRRFPAALVGIAAALLIAFFAGWYLRPLVSPDEIAGLVVSRADQAQLLAEYQELFGPEFSWLVEQPSRSEIGLRPADSKLAAAPRDFVAVRLLLLAKPASSSKWKEVQSLDLVARREEVVEVAAKSNHHSALTLWAYPLDEKMISIDLRYEPSEFAGTSSMPSGFSIESSSVQPMGESAPVVSFEREGVEYRLYQSAVLLPENGVG